MTIASKASNTSVGGARCLVCFTTDKGYLFPTLVSAIQARAYSSEELADVAIYCVGAEPDETRDFAEVCASEGIAFSCIAPHVIEESPVAYARLFLDRFVPERYTQLLYIDGDTQITGELDPLIMANPPRKTFLATTDPVAFKYNKAEDAPEALQAYLKRLGLSSIKQYFNSGVMRINRDGWAEIGSEALRICASTSKHSLHFWDQDGLNAVAASSDVRLPMSVRYNFPIFLRNCRVESVVKPVIYHFMSAPKPWNGNFPPWNLKATLPYIEVSCKYPQLSRYQRRFGAWRKVRYVLQQRVKQLDETVNWGFSWRRAEVLRYEASCAATGHDAC